MPVQSLLNPLQEFCEKLRHITIYTRTLHVGMCGKEN